MGKTLPELAKIQRQVTATPPIKGVSEVGTFKRRTSDGSDTLREGELVVVRRGNRILQIRQPGGSLREKFRTTIIR